MIFNKSWKAKKARKLLDKAIEIKEHEHPEIVIKLYREIIDLDPHWSTPYYNLGLIYKYRCDWTNAFECNKQATSLDPEGDAAWWNLGIAATALNDWRTARQAWNKFNLNYEIIDEITNFDLGTVPIRLNPDDSGEVVWCKRIDPARAIIGNIPLPESGHRFGDLVLNDGAPVGYRKRGETEYPVLNELQLLEKSQHKTYSITLETVKQSDIDALERLCENNEIEMEDWSTIKYLCKQCSEGIVHEHHDQDLVEQSTNRRIGFAALDNEALKNVLQNWAVITLCEFSEIELELE